MIVHRDHDVAVVDKPAGLPSQAEPSQVAFSLTEAVTRELGREARVMHRLDKEASGLVVVALRETAYAPLQHAFTDARGSSGATWPSWATRRTATAWCARASRAIRKDARLRTALDENDDGGRGGLHALSLARARRRSHGAPITAVELQLRDRAHAPDPRAPDVAIGHPLVGDTAYGGAAFERLCLHAYAIELPHPRTGKALRVSSPVPEAFARLVPRLTSPFA